MRPFRYLVADDVDGAVALLARQPHTRFLAGGTNLVDLMKLGVEAPEVLVDLGHLDLGGIDERPDGSLRIGAGVRNSDLAAHPAVRRRVPVLARALLAGASGQLRNMATVGGNLLQRTRCVYFTDITKPCNKRRPGSGCSALAGVSRDLAILGGSTSCIATHPSDLAVALAALDAVVHIRTADGPGSMTMDELYRLPGDEPERDTNLPAGALITAVELPPLAFSDRSTYRKARDRASYAFALGSVAAALDVSGGRVRDVRLAFGAVAHRPWRARVAERELRGAPATPERFRRAVEVELAAAEPQADNAFKVELVSRLTVGVLMELAAAPSGTGAPDGGES